jgi:hypothetical protein
VWNDGSLGCPEPGMMYTQALVNGYWLIIEAGVKRTTSAWIAAADSSCARRVGGIRHRSRVPIEALGLSFNS